MKLSKISPSVSSRNDKYPADKRERDYICTYIYMYVYLIYTYARKVCYCMVCVLSSVHLPDLPRPIM